MFPGMRLRESKGLILCGPCSVPNPGSRPCTPRVSAPWASEPPAPCPCAEAFCPGPLPVLPWRPLGHLPARDLLHAPLPLSSGSPPRKAMWHREGGWSGGHPVSKKAADPPFGSLLEKCPPAAGSSSFLAGLTAFWFFPGSPWPSPLCRGRSGCGNAALSTVQPLLSGRWKPRVRSRERTGTLPAAGPAVSWGPC